MNNNNVYYSVLPRQESETQWGICKRDIETGKSLFVGTYSFSIGGGYDAYVNNRYIFLAPPTYAEEGTLFLQFNMLDAENPDKKSKIVYEHEAAYVTTRFFS